MTLVSVREEPDRGVPSPPTRFLLPLCVAVVLARASYVPRPLRNDEGGYLFLARHWHAGGEFLYGDYFVDRPPLLMLIFRAASLTDWDQAIRVIAIPFVLVFVLAGGRVGTLLGGRTGGRCAAVVAAGVMCCPGLAADQADGELFGATFVMASVALALSAWRAETPARRLWLGAAAGALAAAAPLVKQNLLEGALFLAGLVVFAFLHERDTAARRAAAVASAAVLGVLVTGGGLALWLVSARVDPAVAWRELVGFRGAALGTIWSSSPDASIDRAALILALGVLTGLVPVMVAWFLGARRGVPLAPAERRTISLLFFFGIAAIAAGGSYWPPYLLQLAPACVLAAGAVAPSAGRAGSWMTAAVRTVLTAAAVTTAAAVVVHAAVPWVWNSQRIGEWLAASKADGDTGLVVYGFPSVLESADMASPYPYLWSVPMRTFDPRQDRLRSTLAGPGAPAWIVEMNAVNSWGIDEESRLRDLLHERYRVAAEICGYRVWLRQDAGRQLAAVPPC
ncbi:MAG TPA: hypothetical protein VK402_22170 [Blastococcus sp.]|nr:hypothetical protein [Blastococcus sp.]